MIDLLLKRTGPTGDQYEVFAEDQVVGYVRLSSAARTATPWMWTLAYGQHEDRTRSHGYEATREGRHAGVCQKLAQGMNADGI
jgi:hypothetical protein